MEESKGGPCGSSQARARKMEFSGAGDMEDVQDTGRGFIAVPPPPNDVGWEALSELSGKGRRRGEGVEALAQPAGCRSKTQC